MSENEIEWLLSEPVADALFRSFPLPIALLRGNALALNSRFHTDYGAGVLGVAPLKALLEAPTPGWHTIRVRNARGIDSDMKAQVLRVQEELMLILDDSADPELLREVEQLHARVVELERLGATDRLTGAWNRAHLDRVIVSEVDRAVRFRQPASIVLVDIDHFKAVNDTAGHLVGDSVLRELVQVVTGSIRSADLLFRWGGEEFVVLAASTGHRSAVTLAEKVRANVQQHTFAHVGSVRISVGVAEYVQPESIETWFARVDKALYTAKETGRNRVCVDPRGSSDRWAADNGAGVVRLVWQEAYECGEPTIDREHRELFDLANEVFGASFRPEAPEAFTIALERLLQHIAAHFVDEEAILAKHGYRHLEAHRKAHAALLGHAMELRAAVMAGTSTFGGLVDFLAKNVVAEHLFRVDRDFFPLFRPSDPRED